MFSLLVHNQSLWLNIVNLRSYCLPFRTCNKKEDNEQSLHEAANKCNEDSFKNVQLFKLKPSFIVKTIRKLSIENIHILYSLVNNFITMHVKENPACNKKIGMVLKTYNTKTNSWLAKSLADNVILSASKSILIIQLRHFKTERNITSENLRKNNLIKRVRLLLRCNHGNTLTSKNGKFVIGTNELEKMKMIFFEKGLNKDKLKIAFAEGYIAGQVNKSPNKIENRARLLQLTLTIILTLGVLFSFVTSAGSSIFRIQFGNQSEVNPEKIDVKFKDVKGVDEAKQELKDVVEFIKNPEKFSSLGGKLPKGVLLVGPPGTGKTLLARAVAGEAGVPFFHAAGSEFDEILVGQGARRIRDLFKAAKERAPCVIFIDEIDSVGAKRTNAVLHPYANQTINQLLSEMDGFHRNEGVIVVGATNRRDDLDKALLRPGRFDMEVNVSAPNYMGRKDILTFYLSRIRAKNVDIDVLARGTTGFTGADLENMINQAALTAAIDGADFVSMKYLEVARDKVIMGPERKSRIQDDETNEITAYHESGHAIVAYYTKGSDPLHKVTIMPRGPSLGHTAYIPEKERYHVTKSQLVAMMDTMLGGRAAEEIVFGSDKITTGASSDLKQASSLATHMVKDWGMSEKAGLRTYTPDNNYGLITINEISTQTTSVLDEEINRILQESYERAKTIIKNHKKEHKMLAEALLKYETLDADDIKYILSGNRKQETNSLSKKEAGAKSIFI